MKRKLAILAVAIDVAMASSAVRAHHSHPYFYDQCKAVTIEGRVESVQLKNPHSVIILRLDDGAAYTADWNGLTALTNAGIVERAKAALVFGARVAVTGNPIRDAAQIREHFPDFPNTIDPNIVDPRSIRRVDNSFNWALPPDSTPPDCSRK
jgi:Family of unknown function (DUF6152)